MTAMRFPRDEKEIEVIRTIATSGNDRQVTMLNLNRYVTEAGYPDGMSYRAYMDGLIAFLPNVGGKVLWRTDVLGCVVGNQFVHEILAVWYPSHQAFIDLPNAPGAGDNYRLRNEVVEFGKVELASSWPRPPPKLLDTSTLWTVSCF